MYYFKIQNKYRAQKHDATNFGAEKALLEALKSKSNGTSFSEAELSESYEACGLK